MYNSNISVIDGSNENRLEIYKGIEFELEKLLDLQKTKKETEKRTYSAPANHSLIFSNRDV